MRSWKVVTKSISKYILYHGIRIYFDEIVEADGYFKLSIAGELVARLPPETNEIVGEY